MKIDFNSPTTPTMGMVVRDPDRPRVPEVATPPVLYVSLHELIAFRRKLFDVLEWLEVVF